MKFIMIFFVLSLFVIGSSCSHAPPKSNSQKRLKVSVWADNWFKMYIDGKAVLEDSVPITTERSFNSETFIYEGETPDVVAFIVKDFKENDTGLEYIGTRKQQMGDGGFIAQIYDESSSKFIAVTDKNTKCLVVHKAPLNKACAKEANPIAGKSPCMFKINPLPENWMMPEFDDSSWSNAVEFTAKEVRPKDGYDDINWSKDAKFIWSSDLEQDNTLICRMHLNSIEKNISRKCEIIKNSIEEAGFSKNVQVSCVDGRAQLSSKTYPDHELMNGIVNTNEQVPVPADNYVAPIPLAPNYTGKEKTRDAALAIAVNGVPIYDYTGGGEMSEADLHHHQLHHDTVLTQQLDECGGHAGRGDDYHYHKRPNCMIDTMKNSKQDNKIIGWAFDGYPIYDFKNPDGSIIKKGELDVCNGKLDDFFGYRYHTSKDAPYIIQCLMGEVGDLGKLPRVPPLRSLSGEGKPAGRPPREGVKNLKFTQNKITGINRMEYIYEDKPYYIQFKNAEKKDCYNFESKTVTSNGQIEIGEYCR